MKVFILFAHPEPEYSFNSALLETSVSTLKAQGHEVIVSDLYKMGFNPVASAKDFTERRFPDRLQYDREQKFAVSHQALSKDIQDEIEKVLWCDVFIVQFPLYWFSMPAIIKGWFDRVFVNSLIYGAGKRFDQGGLAGRKAMLCVSTGAYESMFKSDGLLGDINITLWPIHHGIFGYTGLQALPPFFAWSPVYHDGKCDDYLAQYAERMKNLADLEPMPTHWLGDFDENFRLKPEVQPRTVGHSRE